MPQPPLRPPAGPSVSPQWGSRASDRELMPSCTATAPYRCFCHFRLARRSVTDAPNRGACTSHLPASPAGLGHGESFRSAGLPLARTSSLTAPNFAFCHRPLRRSICWIRASLPSQTPSRAVGSSSSRHFEQGSPLRGCQAGERYGNSFRYRDATNFFGPQLSHRRRSWSIVSWQKQTTATGRAQIRKTTEEGRNRCTALTPGDLEMIVLSTVNRLPAASAGRTGTRPVFRRQAVDAAITVRAQALPRTVEHAVAGNIASLRWPRGWATPNLCNHDLVSCLLASPPVKLDASTHAQVWPNSAGPPSVVVFQPRSSFLRAACGIRIFGVFCFFWGGKGSLCVVTESHFAQ